MSDARNLDFAPEQEVRFAVVMYGGVSLAVYIYGVAMELFRLVQATAPEAPAQGDGAAAEPALFHPDHGEGGGRAALVGTAVVYRELGRRLGLDGLTSGGDGAGNGAVRTRFVVDVLSGSSAGGINGILLAKALANHADFAQARRIWTDVADVRTLLAPLLSGEASLLSGRKLYREARRALAELHAPTPGAGDPFHPAYAEQLDLAVTATDLVGLPLPIPIGASESLTEPQHRAVFEFSQGTVATSGEDHSDLLEPFDRMLAFAARATSSFPVAFEPVSVGTLPGHDGDDESVGPQRWFDAYTRRDVEPESVFFADGGYLDNKPFSYATRTLRRRRADVPVVRRLLYVEPDPARELPPERRYGGKVPSIVQNALAGLVKLPRAEPIRQDIADVAERNAAIGRLRDLEREAERDAAGGASVGVAYLSLRLRTVLDRLAEVAAAICRWDVDAAQGKAVRDALRTWALTLTADDGDKKLRAQLLALDAGFEHRRVSFLQDRANELLRGERLEELVAFGRRCGLQMPANTANLRPAGDDADRVRAAKALLNEALDGLRRAERAPWAVRRAEVLGDDLSAAWPTVARTAACASAEPGAYVRAVTAFLAGPLERALHGIGAVLLDRTLPAPSRDLLAAYARRFERFDAVSLPLAHPDLGERNVADVRRVSPDDAPGLRTKSNASKLAGERLAHFGAFLDAGYRRNDLLWGRLNGIEAILDAVLSDRVDPAERDRLRVRAQAAALREELSAAPNSPLAAALAGELAASAGERADVALVEAFARRWRAPPRLWWARRAGFLLRTLPHAVAALMRWR